MPYSLSPDFRSLFERSAIPLTLARADGDVPLVIANDAFIRLTGYSRDFLIGHNCRRLQGPATRTEARQTMREAIRSASETSVLVTNYRSDGSVFESFVFLFPIVDRDGGVPCYFLGSQYDVTGPLQQLSLAEHTSHLRSHVEMGALQLLHGSRLLLESKKLMSRSLHTLLLTALQR